MILYSSIIFSQVSFLFSFFSIPVGLIIPHALWLVNLVGATSYPISPVDMEFKSTRGLDRPFPDLRLVFNKFLRLCI